MAKDQVIKTTLQIDADIQSFEKGLSQIQATLNSLSIPKGLAEGVAQKIATIRANLAKLSELTEGGIVNKKDMAQVNSLMDQISKGFEQLSTRLGKEGIATAALKKDQAALDALTKAQKGYEKAVESTDKIEEKLNKALEEQLRLKQQIEKEQGKKTKDEEKYAQTQATVKATKTNLIKAAKDQAKAEAEAQKRIEASGGKYSSKHDPNFKRTTEGQNLKKATDAATIAQKEYNAAVAEAEKYTSALAEQQAFEKVERGIQQAKDALEDYQTAGKKEDLSDGFDEALNKLKEIKDINWSEFGIDLNTITSYEDLQRAIEQLSGTTGTNATSALSQIQASAEAAAVSEQNLTEKTKSANSALEEQNERASKIEGLTSRIKQFVGLTGAAMAFRRVAQNAIATIKELDAQMTEMAVVTNLDVGDYWKQLPEYTKRANDLGVSIKSAYEAATLYYQQGLKTNEVQQVSNSTLKMARIAGLNAAEATDRMTAALRGFNMEVTQTNADRVADVYSKLAAITASNVNEISVAMTKTASIASNANMEFETTAAFLSQIIETTRESAETAGTALKTVIARFQELKKDPAEIGEVDGEIIDANKIETALRSVGVALRDTSGQFRDLDDVFMELASKWDSLDTNTQRYIATIAAGSRQQSRFIAMMSNYSRTTELVSAANNAAGTSNQQFQKTLESLESKLAQLKNAWDQFTMGLMNSDLIKAGIDLLTEFLNAINKITQGWDSFSGGAMKIGLITVALYAADKALKVFIASFKSGNGIFASFGAVGSSAIDSIKLKILSLQNSLNSIKKSKTIIKMNSGQVIVAKKSIDNYNNAQKERIKNDKVIETLQAKKTAGATLDAESQQLLNISLRQQNELRQREKDLLIETTALTGLNETQTMAAIAIEELGVGTKEAAILATKGITAEELKELSVKTGLTAETIAATAAGTAEKATKLGGFIATKLSTLALKLEARAKNGSTIATWLQTAANWALNASLGMILVAVLAIIAAIAILVVAIYLIVKAIKEAKKNSPEGQLKKAQENLEQVTEAANEAAEAYTNLNDAINGLKDKYKTLDELTVGTREWKDAVYEVNQQVLDLIEQYPELAEAYEKDQNGVFRLVNQNLQDEVLNKAQNKKFAYANGQLIAKSEVSKKQEEVDYQNLGEKGQIGNQALNNAKVILGSLFAGGPASPVGWMVFDYLEKQRITEEQTNEIYTKELAKALAKGEYFKGDYSKENIAKYLTEELGIASDKAKKWSKELENTIPALKNFGKTLINNEKQQEEAYKGMAANAINLMDFSKISQEQKTIINAATNGKLMKIYFEQQELNEDKFEEWRLNEYKNSRVKKGQIQQKDEEGKWQNIISVSAAKELYTTEEATKKLANTQNDQLRIIKEFQKTQPIINKVLASNEGLNLTVGQLQEATKTIAVNLTDIPNELKQRYEELYANNIKIANEVNEKFQEKWKNANIKDANYLKDTTTGALQQLSKNYQFVLNRSGQKAVEDISGLLDEVTKNMAKEQLQDFITQLNAINDWSNLGDWENFYDSLKELGIIIDDKIVNFVNVVAKNAKATYEFGSEAEKERYKTYGKILKEIINEGKNSFSESEYKEILKILPEFSNKFIEDLEGDFIYLGDNLGELVDAIRLNTEALLSDSFKYSQDDIKLKKIINSNEQLQSKINNYSGDNIQEKQNYIADLQKDIDPAIWNSIFGSTSIWLLDEKNIDKIISKLKNINTFTYQQILSNLSLAGQSETINEQINKLYTFGIQNKQNEKGTPEQIYAQASMEAYEKSLLLEAENRTIAIPFIERFKEAINEYINGTEIDFNKDERIQDFLTQLYINPLKEFVGIEEQTALKFDRLKDSSEQLEKILDLVIEKQEGTTQSFNKIKEILKEQMENYKQQYIIAIQLKNIQQSNLNALLESNQFKNSAVNFDNTTGLFSLKQGANLDNVTEEDIKLWQKISTTWANIQETENDIKDVESSYIKQQKKSKDDYINLLTELRNIEINTRQEQIDKLTSLNDTIKDVQSDLISNVREALEEDRRIRENNEKLQEIQDKETRLSYLMAESGSGNELEILQLQKEISEAQQEYQDSLIDQQLDAMEKANEEASEQRDKQIEIQQNQLAFWEERYSWKELDAQLKEILNNSDEANLLNTLISSQGPLSEIQKDGKITEYMQMISNAFGVLNEEELPEPENIETIPTALMSINTLITNIWGKLNEDDASDKDLLEEKIKGYEIGDFSSASYENLNKIKDEIYALRRENPNITEEQSKRLSAIQEKASAYQYMQMLENTTSLNDLDSTYGGLSGMLQLFTQENAGMIQSKYAAKKQEFISKLGDEYNQKQSKEAENAATTSEYKKDNLFGLSELTRGHGAHIQDSEGTVYDIAIKNADWYEVGEEGEQKIVEEANPGQLFIVGDDLLAVRGNNADIQLLEGDYPVGIMDKLRYTKYDFSDKMHERKRQLNKKIYGYKTGGLADFTGPAWLDGTPSAPELVLNQADTKNFIALRDILAEVMRGTTISNNETNNQGDVYVDVDINVDSIDGDYDVEQLAQKVQDVIVRDSTYRNPNSINTVR